MFSWASAAAAVGSVAEYVKTIFAGKYYVEQQLAKMQVHRLEKDQLIDKATGRSKLIVQNIFDEYDKLIEAEKWRWIKRGNELKCYKINEDNICTSSFHDGIFPPLGAIRATMENCKDVIQYQEATIKDVTDTLQAWTKTYSSYLEYWVLQLEALEQDMAVTLKT